MARSHGELVKIEGSPRLVVTEEQVPSLFVCLDPFALQRRRQVEHDDVGFVMSEDGGNVVPTDRVGPGFERGLDPELFGVGVFRHCAGSFVGRGRTKEHEPDKRGAILHENCADPTGLRLGICGRWGLVLTAKSVSAVKIRPPLPA